MRISEVVIGWLRFVLNLLSRVARDKVSQPRGRLPATPSVTTAAPPSPSAAPPTAVPASPPSTTAAPQSSDPLFAPRRLRAKNAGLQAKAKLAGEKRAVEKTPARPGGRGSPRFYCVARRAADLPTGSCVVSTWPACLALIRRSGRGGLCEHSIFHSFPERFEAEAYWLAAGLGELPAVDN